MSDLDGLFDTISHEDRNAEVPPAEPSQEAQSEGATAPEENTEVEETPAAEQATPEEKTTEAPSQSSEEQETKTESENTEAEVEDYNSWRENLLPPPVLPAIKQPEFDEDGNITNMDRAEYEDYLVAKAENRLVERNYNQYVENSALDVAEKILPEIKTDKNIRTLVEAMRTNQVISGQDASTVDAALAVKQILQSMKSQGEQNAKVQIEVQQRAAVETGASQKQEEPSKVEALKKRLDRGDEEAFAEWLGILDEQGK